MRRSIPIVALTVALLAAAAPSAAASDIVVAGTSDVTDSGLLRQKIVPEFEREYKKKGYKLRYSPVGSGRALSDARAGQADAVLVNAPELEREFVDDGFSAERSGRAVFYDDHVLLGPITDPAGVLTGARRDVAGAFERIAAAGAVGRANFVSRGDDDGTNLVELGIWDRTNVARNTGRGEPGTGATATAAWYRRTGAGQADTVMAAEKCDFAGGGCYVLTGRSTYRRLLKLGRLKQLRVVVDENDDDSPGGRELLANPYHAYMVDPERVGSVNEAGAEAFLDFLTSRGFQNDLEDYPDEADDPYFLPTARPAFDLESPAGGRLPRKLAANDPQTISGRLRHRQPFHGALDGAPIYVQRVVDEDEFVQLADDKTDPGGDYRMKFRPTRTGEYRVFFPGGFDLQPAWRGIGRVRVRAVVNLLKAKARTGGAELRGHAYPDDDRKSARLVVLGRRAGSERWKRVGTEALGDTGRSFVTTVELDRGNWELRVRYEDPGAVTAGSSQPRSVSVR